MKRPDARFFAFFAFILAFLPVGRVASWAQVQSRVFLNGVSTPVFFNDGDSFSVLEGPLRGTRARLAGFNTLESTGPIHQWGPWHPFELYVIAKRATLNARRGTWHCTSNMRQDSYGRLLWYCPDLAVDQIRKGLAMAYSVDDRPARFEYIRAQRLAQQERRGMWHFGVPDFIVTSVHSSDEDPSRSSNYNRLISSEDGHSEKWEHHDQYGVCELICAEDIHVDHGRIDDAVRALREDPELGPMLQGLYDNELINVVSRYARRSELPEWLSEDHPSLSEVLTARLAAMDDAGAFGERVRARGACVMYVPFNRWYGQNRASCLDHH